MSASTHVAPLALDEIDDPELRALVERCAGLGVPDALFPRILARVPNYAKALLRAMLHSHYEGNVDHRLKEVMRVQLARFAGDPYFAALRSQRALDAGLDEATIAAGSGDYDDDPRFSEAERIALRYSDQMYLDPSKVDRAFYEEMKRHFSEAEIMELGAFIALHYGMQVFMRTLGRAAGG
ncbi:MAG: carboxymuconolactone decarboxylase family protein [Burkholderiales bacterium]|nr:carboxymuconolactone decarboxylase family protein [Burkholderiales bacterium]